MRKFLFTIKAGLCVVLMLGALLFVYARRNAPVFERGEHYELYTGTSSEDIVLASSPFEKLFLTGIKGESVRYQGNRAEELIKRFHAAVLFIQEAAGVTNYYCYSPVLMRSVQLNGEKVNLHIAVRGSKTAAGTPIIFGGF